MRKTPDKVAVVVKLLKTTNLSATAISIRTELSPTVIHTICAKYKCRPPNFHPERYT